MLHVAVVREPAKLSSSEGAGAIEEHHGRVFARAIASQLPQRVSGEDGAATRGHDGTAQQRRILLSGPQRGAVAHGQTTGNTHGSHLPGLRADGDPVGEHVACGRAERPCLVEDGQEVGPGVDGVLEHHPRHGEEQGLVDATCTGRLGGDGSGVG